MNYFISTCLNSQNIKAILGLFILTLFQILPLAQGESNHLPIQIITITMDLILIIVLILKVSETLMNSYTLLLSTVINGIALYFQQDKQYIVFFGISQIIFIHKFKSKWRIVLMLAINGLLIYQTHQTSLNSAFFTIFTSVPNRSIERKLSSGHMLHVEPLRRGNSDEERLLSLLFKTIVLEKETLFLKAIDEELNEMNIQIDQILNAVIEKADIKVKGQKIRDVISNSLVRNEIITILKTTFAPLNIYLIKISAMKDYIYITLIDVQGYRKYIEKHSCYSLMNRLFSSFSHEFGTLLNQILLIMQTGNQRKHLKEDEYINILNAGKLMEYMVNDLQVFYQVQTNKFAITLSCFNISQIFQDLQQLYQNHTQQRQMKLIFKNNVINDIQQDELRIKQVLVILISNAFKFTFGLGQIAVTADIEDKNRIKFSVDDTGKGMNQEICNNLNELLQNNKLFITQKISKETAGLGLGLMNSKAIIRGLSSFRQQNEILYFNSQENVGTKFWFYVWKGNYESPQSSLEKVSITKVDKKIYYSSLEMSPPPPSLFKTKSDQTGNVIVLKKENKLKSLTNLARSQMLLSVKMSQPPVEEAQEEDGNSNIDHVIESPSITERVQHQYKILAVDDEIFNLQALKRLIEIIGHSCIYATNGFEAIDLLRQNQNIQLILMDINMPQIDGFQTTKLILQEFDLKFKIVACSAFQDSESIYQALKSGMIDYLQKPVNKDKLEQIFQKYVSH